MGFLSLSFSPQATHTNVKKEHSQIARKSTQAKHPLNLQKKFNENCVNFSTD